MASKKGLEAFRTQHDKSFKVPKKITDTLEAMLKEGADRWEYDADFRTLTGLSPGDLGEYRDKFVPHLVMAPPSNGKRDARLIWCASPKFAKDLLKVPGAKPYTVEG